MDLGKLDEKLVDKKEVVVWDFDGTIVKLDIAWDCLRKDLTDLAEIRNSAKRSLGEVLSRLINGGLRRRAFEIIETYEKQSNYTPNKQVVAFIKRNSDKYRMAIFSDNLRNTVVRILKDLGVFNCFEAVVCKDDVNEYKPNPEGLKEIHESLGIKDKAGYVMVGDSEKDSLAASLFGIDYWNLTG